MTIILPEGACAAWQLALIEDTHAHWDTLATDLLREATLECDRSVRDDLLTLALVACERSMEVFGLIERLQIPLAIDKPATPIADAVRARVNSGLNDACYGLEIDEKAHPALYWAIVKNRMNHSLAAHDDWYVMRVSVKYGNLDKPRAVARQEAA